MIKPAYLTTSTWAERGTYWAQMAPKGRSANDETNQLLIEATGIEEGFDALDIASGAGEPAISIALKVGKAGSVTCLDVNPEMLQGARNRAENLNLKQMCFKIGDMAELPFADTTFDAVTCRYGIMFPSDPIAALRQVRRVLKSGRTAAFMTHGPPKANTLSVTLRQATREYFCETGDDSSMRRFKYSGDDELAELFRAAGFSNVGTRAIHKTLERPIEGRFWEPLLLRSSGNRLMDLSDSQVNDLHNTIREKFAPFLNDDHYEFSSAEQLAWGQS